MTKTQKIVWTIIAAVLLGGMVFLVSGCKSNPETGEQEVDWAKVDVAGDEIIVALDDQAALWAHKPDTAEKFEKLAEIARTLDGAVHAYATSGNGSLEDIEDYVDAAIVLADELKAGVDPQEEQDLYASISGVRSALGLIRILIT